MKVKIRKVENFLIFHRNAEKGKNIASGEPLPGIRSNDENYSRTGEKFFGKI